MADITAEEILKLSQEEIVEKITSLQAEIEVKRQNLHEKKLSQMCSEAEIQEMNDERNELLLKNNNFKIELDSDNGCYQKSDQRNAEEITHLKKEIDNHVTLQENLKKQHESELGNLIQNSNSVDITESDYKETEEDIKLLEKKIEDLKNYNEQEEVEDYQNQIVFYQRLIHENETLLKEAKTQIEELNEELKEKTETLKVNKEASSALEDEVTALKLVPADTNKRGNGLFSEVEDYVAALKKKIHLIQLKLVEKNHFADKKREEVNTLLNSISQMKHLHHSEISYEQYDQRRIKINELTLKYEALKNRLPSPQIVTSSNNDQIKLKWIDVIVDNARQEVNGAINELISNNYLQIAEDCFKKNMQLKSLENDYKTNSKLIDYLKSQNNESS